VLRTPETLLQAAQKPLLIGHIAPDGDTIGSLLGLGWALREVGKQPTLACADPVPEGLRFLPGACDIGTEASGAEDLVVALDSSDLLRLGSVYDGERFAHLPLLNIDHHVTNTRFGNVHLIAPTAASTAQLVYGLLRRLEWPISPTTATCLLTGLVTDTRSFRTSNTDAEALRVALALVEAGAPLAEINEQLERGLSLGLISLWGKVLSNTQFRDGIVWAEISQEVQRECGVANDDNGGLVSFIASVREAQIAVLLTEREDGSIEVGMRAVPGVDVSGVALALGGGGHPQAAGCTLPGPLAVARETLLCRLVDALASAQHPIEGLSGESDAIESPSLPG
jgi:phosphoesterase RecJ-like protein